MCVHICSILISYPVATTSRLHRLRNKWISSILDLELFQMNEKRSMVEFFYEQNFSPAQIFHRLKNDGFSRLFIRRTINRLKETGSVDDRKRSGRRRAVRTPARIKAVGARIRRNPRRSQRKLASQMDVSRRSIQRIVKEDLGLTPFKRRKAHGLSKQQRKTRLERSKALLQRYADEDVERIVFSDEKLFVIEEHLNAQNDRVYAAAFEDIPEQIRTVQRFQKAGSVMVWGAISSRGKLPLVFVEPGVKVNAIYYRDSILAPRLVAGAQRVIGEDRWTFQQDSAPAHAAKITQDWCRAHTPDFISSSEWPPSSPDLNPLDYTIWGVLEAKVNAIQHTSLDSLKKTLRDEWRKLPMATVRNSVAAWRRRLKAVVKQRGGRFE
jgi:inhibitor of nuclear factor kappa-B kinase subunit alpha